MTSIDMGITKGLKRAVATITIHVDIQYNCEVLTLQQKKLTQLFIMICKYAIESFLISMKPFK